MLRLSRCARLNFRYPHSVIITAIESRGYADKWWFPWLNKLGTVKLTMAFVITTGSAYTLYSGVTLAYREFFTHAQRKFDIKKQRVVDASAATSDDERTIKKGMFGGKFYKPDGNQHFKGRGSIEKQIAPGTAMQS